MKLSNYISLFSGILIGAITTGIDYHYHEHPVLSNIKPCKHLSPKEVIRVHYKYLTYLDSLNNQRKYTSRYRDSVIKFYNQLYNYKLD